MKCQVEMVRKDWNEQSTLVLQFRKAGTTEMAGQEGPEDSEKTVDACFADLEPGTTMKWQGKRVQKTQKEQSTLVLQILKAEQQ